MGVAEDLTRMLNDIYEKNAIWKARMRECCERRFSVAAENAYKEFGEYQRQKIESIFNAAINAFYNAYSPKVYERTGGLYNLLNMSMNEKGLVDYDSAIDLIDPNNMHPDRSGGDSLFETVFIQGWHGGARSIDSGKSAIWGTHPNTGDAYYRTRGLVTYPDTGVRKMHRFGKWGKIAYRSESPFQIFSSDLQAEESEGGEIHQKFMAICQKNWDDMCEKLQNDARSIKREVYG